MNKIRLPRDGTEYASFHFSPADIPVDAVLEASIGGGPWTALDRSAAVPRLLLRGPASTGTLGLLVPADGQIRVRVQAAPEVIVRGAGYVALVS